MGDVASPFFPDVARGAEDELAAAGYSLILSSSRRDPERERRNVKHLLERSTDGLILGAPQCPPEELAEMAQRADVADGVPEPRGEGPRVAAVWIDWPTATTEVVTYLADLGHRRHRAGRPVARATRAGRQPRGLVPAGARSRRVSVPSARWSSGTRCRSRAGHAAGQRLLAAEPRPTAAICHNDVMAIGLLQACAEHRAARPRGPVHRRVGRRAVREPRHAPAHHRARAPVRARPGRGAKAARA